MRACACMYVCTYVYVCMYECLYVCMYACMHVCMYVWIDVCIYVCMYVCTYVCMHVNMCVYVCRLVCLHVCRWHCFLLIERLLAASHTSPHSLVAPSETLTCRWPAAHTYITQILKLKELLYHLPLRDQGPACRRYLMGLLHQLCST